MESSILICNKDDNVSGYNGKIINYTNDIDTLSELSKIKESIDSIKIRFDIGENSSEYYGLEFSVKLRLSKELPKNIRYAPIIIISDSSNELRFVKNLLRRDKFNLLSTEGFYFEENPKKLTKLDDISFNSKFLKIININPPIDRTGNHGVANKWAIKRWSEVLDVTDNDTIRKNNNEIDNQLYTKYLEMVHGITNTSNEKEDFEFPKESGNIILIDDESHKGWGDIMRKLTESCNGKISFSPYCNAEEALDSFNKLIPDVVILDLRLEEKDEDENNIENMKSIKTMNVLKSFNPGIQFIILSATSKSTILDKLNQKKIVGFVKKEHPEDTSIKTTDSISRLSELIDIGLKNSYLKTIYKIEKELLSLSLFDQNNFNTKQQSGIAELKREIQNVSAVLDSNVEKKIIFGMLTIYKLIETINMIYIKEETVSTNPTVVKAFWFNNNNIIITSEDKRSKRDGGITSTEYKFKCILEKFSLSDEINKKLLSDIKNFRNCEIHPENQKYDHSQYNSENITTKRLEDWFSLIYSLIISISKKPQISTETEFNKEQKDIQKSESSKEILKEINNKTRGVKSDFDKKDHGLRNDGLSVLAQFK